MDTTRKCLLLTGASRGIGHATVKVFQSRGWQVFTVSRQPFDEKCPWPGGRLAHIQADLSDLEAIPALADELRRRLPADALHGLVNNAGISPKGEGGARLGVMATDAAAWLRVLSVNMISTALLTRALFPELAAARGNVVNVTSIAGTRVHPFAGTAYACSKAAMAALTREMAHELGPHGVRVNAIAPGEIDTSILSPGTAEIVERDIPLRRLGTPTEVAETIFFLSSEAAAYTNGAEIHINGGQHV